MSLISWQALRINELEAEVARLVKLLAGEIGEKQIVALRQELLCSHTVARLLLRLYGASGPLSNDLLFLQLAKSRQKEGADARRLLVQYVYMMREAIPGGIETYHRYGYRMTSEGRKTVARALAKHGLDASGGGVSQPSPTGQADPNGG